MTRVRWRGESISRIVLGTAQLGFDYGISNERGQPGREVAREIVCGSVAGGVNCFDTARAYGESERVLGEILSDPSFPGREVAVVTKIDPATAARGQEEVAGAIRASLETLGVGQLFCCMLHWAQSLDHWENGLGAALLDAGGRGLIRWIGVSCYTVAEARRALDHPEVAVLQVPFNAWDQRMLVDGVFREAAACDKLVFVRSIFLQGLLLMGEGAVTTRLPFAAGVAAEWAALASEWGLSRRELAARVALAPGMPMVVGAATAREADENTGLAERRAFDEKRLEAIRERMAPHLNERISNPAKW
jgi:aryl-alcohol dehydrogenase-like predicted oxidoreductase